MTTIYVHQGGLGDFREIRPALDEAERHRLIGEIQIHGGVYPETIDTYQTPVPGGTSWGMKFVIRPYKRERVVLRPTGGDFAIRLAHESASYVEIGSSLVDFEIDASQLSGPTATAVKITNATNAGCAHHVRLKRPKVYGALHQGILITDTHHCEILGGASYDNGHDLLSVGAANKDHGLYLGSGAWDNKVIGFSTYRNGAYGIHEYGGETPGKCGRNLIDGGYHFCNGRLASYAAGVLLGGTNTIARRITCTGNGYGVFVYRTARGCWFNGDLEGNRNGRSYIAPEAVDCEEIGLL